MRPSDDPRQMENKWMNGSPCGSHQWRAPRRPPRASAWSARGRPAWPRTAARGRARTRSRPARGSRSLGATSSRPRWRAPRRAPPGPASTGSRPSDHIIKAEQAAPPAISEIWERTNGRIRTREAQAGDWLPRSRRRSRRWCCGGAPRRRCRRRRGGWRAAAPRRGGPGWRWWAPRSCPTLHRENPTTKPDHSHDRVTHAHRQRGAERNAGADERASERNEPWKALRSWSQSSATGGTAEGTVSVAMRGISRWATRRRRRGGSSARRRGRRGDPDERGVGEEEEVRRSPGGLWQVVWWGATVCKLGNIWLFLINKRLKSMQIWKKFWLCDLEMMSKLERCN